MKRVVSLLKKNKSEAILLAIFFIFSWLLMWKTFKVSGNYIKIATKVWSDFGATIPLIRSFSFGSNFPPEYPIFAGPPIRYHFVFFAIVGFLEKLGFPLDWSLNLMSTISFFALLTAIYFLTKRLFKKRITALFAVLLFLFNGSFGFMKFFNKYPLNIDTPAEIVKNATFSSFGPYDGGVVSAFWSLNIFTNQRHLALAYASFLILILAIYSYSKKPRKLSYIKSIALGLVIGVFPFIHLAIFGMMGIALLVFFLIYPKIRSKIFLAGLVALTIAIPQILYMGGSQVANNFVNPGYLVENPNAVSIGYYWLMNLGVSLITIPAGFLLANKEQRKVLLPFFTLFVVGNIFQFSLEMAANHKFINLFVIGGNMFTALFLTKLWEKKYAGKIATAALLVPLTLTGVIDFFPIFNDRYIEIADIPTNKAATFIYQGTAKNSVFLNSSYLYSPASIAGRKIFLGWPYFSWSAGYDTDKRSGVIEKIYSSDSKEEICLLMKENKIDYFITRDTTGNKDYPNIDLDFFEKNFNNIYSDEILSIYKVSTNCGIR